MWILWGTGVMLTTAVIRWAQHFGSSSDRLFRPIQSVYWSNQCLSFPGECPTIINYRFLRCNCICLCDWFTFYPIGLHHIISPEEIVKGSWGITILLVASQVFHTNTHSACTFFEPVILTDAFTFFAAYLYRRWPPNAADVDGHNISKLAIYIF